MVNCIFRTVFDDNLFYCVYIGACLCLVGLRDMYWITVRLKNGVLEQVVRHVVPDFRVKAMRQKTDISQVAQVHFFKCPYNNNYYYYFNINIYSSRKKLLLYIV